VMIAFCNASSSARESAMSTSPLTATPGAF
jgi:hypothetical protein